MATDLGLDWLSSIDLFGIAMCIMLFLLAAKMRSYPFCVASAVGFITIGVKILAASQELISFMAMFAISAGMVLYGAKMKEWD